MDGLSARVKHSLSTTFFSTLLLCSTNLVQANEYRMPSAAEIMEPHTHSAYLFLADASETTVSPLAPTTEDETSDESNEEEDTVGYLEGCTGGAAVGSIVPGIGTLIGGILGCGIAWLW